jgi:diguanylate cyclase (GGDEF)-like protein
MYYVCIGLLALTVHCIINLEYINPNRNKKIPASMERYRLFLITVAVFYFSDSFWGLFTQLHWRALAYLNTLMFFMSMVVSVLFWTRFVISYLGRKDKFNFVLTTAAWAIFFFEIVTLIINLFKPVVFYYDQDGEYHTGVVRSITLYAQLALYFLTALYSLKEETEVEGRSKVHHKSIGVSALVMALFVLLQALIPLMPLYSMGCLIATCIIHTYVVMDEKTEQSKALGSVKQIAYKDPLTGLKSARAYQEAKENFNQKISGLQLKELGVIVLDLNGLKQVNDNLGHEEGDRYIKEGSAMICKQFQHSPVYRIGGDEFVVLLEGDDYRQRITLLDEFNKQMEENAKTGGIVISSGLDVFRPGRDIDFNSIFERADQRMYERKKALKAMEPRIA